MYLLLSTRLRCTLFMLLLGTVFLAIPSTTRAQETGSVSGHWSWKEVRRRNKPQRQFTLTIQQTANKLSGTYSVDEFINGKWQGEDGNQTPFAGRVKGGVIEIEFDPMATVPGYQENVVYAIPSDGRKPSIASVNLKGNLLIWTHLRGAAIEGIPPKITLRRELPKKR